MWTTIRITSWKGVEETLDVTGFAHQRGSMIAFHKRDLDGGRLLRNEDGTPQMDAFMLASDVPGAVTLAKVEVFNRAGSLIETICGTLPVEAPPEEQGAAEPAKGGATKSRRAAGKRTKTGP